MTGTGVCRRCGGIVSDAMTSCPHCAVRLPIAEHARRYYLGCFRVASIVIGLLTLMGVVIYLLVRV